MMNLSHIHFFSHFTFRYSLFIRTFASAMKKIVIISAILLLCSGIGFTEENEEVSFSADIPHGRGTVTMRFHFSHSKSACAVGDEEYNKTCIPADLDGELIIPDSIVFGGKNCPIKWISRGSFQSCPNLTRVKLPSNLRTISDLAFQGCTSLREITFPDSINCIYPRAFIGCTALRRVRFLSATPPKSYDNDTFDDVTYATATLVVPVETAEHYLSNPLTYRFRYHAETLPLYRENEE